MTPGHQSEIPPDAGRAYHRPGGSFVAAIEAGGPLADLVALADARDDARRGEVARVAREAASLTDPRPPASQ